MDAILDLLPVLPIREAWAVGLIVVLAALRPVGRLGWAAATALLAAGISTIIVGADGFSVLGLRPLWGSVALLGWLVLGALLASTVIAPPLRWEPRTGPGAATALIAGSAFVHTGIAWHAGGAPGVASAGWLSGALGPGDLDALSAGPLGWPIAWVLQAPPVITPRGGGILLGLVAVALVVAGADRLGRRWGHLGTARCTAAAVAWAPPLLLSHAAAPWALLATAALVWSWWALAEVWAGRHRSGRIAFVSGGLLGVAVGIALWPVVLAPLWMRRFGARTAGWSIVGFGTAILAAVAAMIPTRIGFADVWQAGVVSRLEVAVAPWWVAALIGLAALLLLAISRPLSPTRLSAMTAALLLAIAAWWPADAVVAGAVPAIPFVLLAAVAPDKPEERWPPDSEVTTTGRRQVEV
ncbi:MAG: hypothetical protein KY437_02625 [Actinobacteria bacterium]|nr:hypothetical protein [Actinomycetota bacterium]